MKVASSSTVLIVLCVPLLSSAAPPISADVDVYSSLCKIGSQSTVAVAGEIGAISRRILAGEGKLSASKLQDEFPGIRDEKNRMLVLQSFQECMYRYIDRFHPSVGVPGATAAATLNPSVPAERRREIVYLANELETFKQKMSSALATIPEQIYDKSDSTQKRPRDDPRLIGLADYSRYKAFEAASGGLDFSNATNNDLVLLCTTYSDEITAYNRFGQSNKKFGLPGYAATPEVKRVCAAASKGR